MGGWVDRLREEEVGGWVGWGRHQFARINKGGELLMPWAPLLCLERVGGWEEEEGWGADGAAGEVGGSCLMCLWWLGGWEGG